MNRELIIELARWNGGITRSRREYETHPFAESCTPNHQCYFNRARNDERAARAREARRVNKSRS